MDPLVIGIGNSDRGDDAIGLMVVRALSGLRTKELADCSGLLDVWEAEDHVIVVDAMRSGGTPGTVQRFDMAAEGLPTRSFPSTHSFGLGEMVELGRALGRLPDLLIIYGIEADHLDHGRSISPAVSKALVEAVSAIEGEAT
jgi:hydrogenase maturation protease